MFCSGDFKCTTHFPVCLKLNRALSWSRKLCRRMLTCFMLSLVCLQSLEITDTNKAVSFQSVLKANKKNECSPLYKQVPAVQWCLTCECLRVLGKVILASTKAVYVLVPLPLERQIQDLLASQRVEEALILTEGAQRNIPKDKYQVTKQHD